MTRSISIKLKADPCRSLDRTLIVANYTAVGTALTHAARLILVQNLTNVAVWFSINGVDNHFPLDAKSHMVLDITANKTIDSGFFMGEGDCLYVKRLGTPSSGAVYFTVFYGS